MTPTAPRIFSIELLLVVGLPLLTLVAGALTLALAFGQGFTPLPAATPPPVTAQHGD
jgi:hypothetical protein